MGRPLAGKSRYVASRFIPRWPDVVTLDPTGKSPGHAVTGCEEAIEAMDAGRFPLSVMPGFDSEKDLAYILRYALAREHTTVVIEEVAFFCKGMDSPRWLEMVSRFGRHSNVSLIYTGQRPIVIPRVLTALASHFVIAGPFTDRGDIGYLADTCGEATAAASMTNPVGAYIVADLNTGARWRETLDGVCSPL